MWSWLPGGSRGNNDPLQQEEEEEEDNSAAAAAAVEDDVEDSRSETDSPLRKRTRTNNNEGNNNNNDDNNDDNNNDNNNEDGDNYEDHISNEVSRQLTFDDCVESSFDENNDGTEGERVYVADDNVRDHVQMENQHWRNLVWDPLLNKFFYENDGVPQDGIPEADGYKIINPTDETMEVRVVVNKSRALMKKQYENEVNQLLATLDQLGIPKTTAGLTDHLFGDKSRLMQSLVKALGKESHEIHQFLATIYFALPEC